MQPVFELEKDGHGFSYRSMQQVNTFHGEIVDHFSQREILKRVERLVRENAKVAGGAGSKPAVLVLPPAATSVDFSAPTKESASRHSPSPCYRLSLLPPVQPKCRQAFDLRNRTPASHAKPERK